MKYIVENIEYENKSMGIVNKLTSDVRKEKYILFIKQYYYMYIYVYNV